MFFEASSVKKIHSQHDVELFKTTQAYQNLLQFIRLLAQKTCLQAPPIESCSSVVTKLQILLEHVRQIKNNTVLDQSPQRAGNLAFRTCMKTFIPEVG
jgi:ribosome maturation factor RimP